MYHNTDNFCIRYSVFSHLRMKQKVRLNYTKYGFSIFLCVLRSDIVALIEFLDLSTYLKELKIEEETNGDAFQVLIHT